MLIFALLAVFIAGLMVGRTPEYLGKKIQAAEMKLVVLYLLVVPTLILAFASMSVLLDQAKASILNPGPHGLSEVVYAFTSAANNNGSAFGGLTGQHRLVQHDARPGDARRPLPADRPRARDRRLARAQAARARRRPGPSRPARRSSPGCSSRSILIVVALTYFPVLALGPILEHLSL